jgi:hypothetical protein
VGSADTRWDLAAARVGNAVLARCPRWLIIVEGVGSHASCAPYGCCWGENLQGAATHPVALDDPSRLVLSPHVYGHGAHAYLSEVGFPDNMPTIWWRHWGRMANETGHAVLVGEWGGLWVDATRNGRTRSSTRAWQQRLTTFLVSHGIGFLSAPPLSSLDPYPLHPGPGTALSRVTSMRVPSPATPGPHVAYADQPRTAHTPSALAPRPANTLSALAQRPTECHVMLRGRSRPPTPSQLLTTQRRLDADRLSLQ